MRSLREVSASGKGTALLLAAGVLLALAGTPAQAVTILNETFEGSFPAGNGWTIYGDPSWDDSIYKAAGGSRSGYCADTAIPAPGPYAPDMNAWMDYGPFDLSDATAGSVTFQRWMNCESNYDYFKRYVSIDGIMYYGYQESGDDSASGWVTKSIDFTAVPTLGNVCGQSQVWFALVFSSDGSLQYEGVYVDDIVIEKTVGGGGSDLAPINLSASPLTLAAGDSISFSYEIYNNGPNAATGTVTVDCYLSTNAIISPADTLLASSTFTVSGLASGASDSSATLSVTIPSGTAPGNYYFGLLITPEVSIGDANSLNDYVSVPITVTGGGDDIYEDNDTLATAWNFSTGETQWLSSYGGQPGIQADDDWYRISVTTGYTLVEIDCTFTDADGNIDIDLVDASGTVLASSRTTSDNEYISHDVAGDGYSGGTFYIRVYWGDAGNSYDLWWDDLPPSVTTHTIAALAGSGGAISPSGSVTVNDGANQSFTITPNAGYSIADVLVDGVSVGSVSSYTFSNVTADHTISASFTTSGSDLEPINLSASPLTLHAGDSISFSYEIYNNGPDAATGTVTVERYLSTNATISAADTFLSSGPFIVSGLASGASDSSATLSVTIPSGTAAGNYYLGLLITPEAGIADTNSSNDYVSVPIAVTSSGSDLKPINLSASPLTLAAGDSIRYSYSIYNNGPDAATGTVTVERYLSTDVTISVSDTLLDSGYISPNGLLPGQSISSTTLSVTIPSGTAAGNYYLGLLITPEASIEDANSSNDYVSVPITVTSGGGGSGVGCLPSGPAAALSWLLPLACAAAARRRRDAA